jgi:hypothetical protein
MKKKNISNKIANINFWIKINERKFFFYLILKNLKIE